MWSKVYIKLEIVHFQLMNYNKRTRKWSKLVLFGPSLLNMSVCVLTKNLNNYGKIRQYGQRSGP